MSRLPFVRVLLYRVALPFVPYEYYYIVSLHDDHNIVSLTTALGLYLFCVMCVNVLVFVLCVDVYCIFNEYAFLRGEPLQIKSEQKKLGTYAK